jgi:hypothetical protein
MTGLMDMTWAAISIRYRVTRLQARNRAWFGPDGQGRPAEACPIGVWLAFNAGYRGRDGQDARQMVTERLVALGATENNLKNINAKIPLRRFTCVTGVSGSGKSTLMIDVLYRALARKLNGATYEAGAYKEIQGVDWLDKIVDVDQGAIGRTPRSNPATYTGIWDHVREMYSQTPEARVRAYKVGRFSLNRHFQNISDRLITVTNFERFPIEPFSFTDITWHIDGRQKVHLNGNLPISFAVFTTTARNIEGKSSYFIGTNARLWCL